MAINRQMLGKLETVFMYMAHFFLSTWPENRPGILFLTDSSGGLLQLVPLQAGQTWTPLACPLHTGEDAGAHLQSIVSQAIATRETVIDKGADGTADAAWAIVPLKEKDGRVRATIGLAIPKETIDFDLASFVKGMEPLILMGYDAYIHHATSEIVMNANRHESARELLKSVIQQVAGIISKGYCSAVRLDAKGFLVPQERMTTESADKGAEQIGQIAQRFVGQAVTPMTGDDNRLVVYPITCEGKPLFALFLHLPPVQSDCFYDERDIAFLQETGEKISYALQRAIIADEIRREAQKKELLYELTKKIQASIDVNDVLAEIMKSIGQLYPYFEAELYLTVDTNTSLPVKQLSFQSGQNDEYSCRAYMEGKLTIGTQEKHGKVVSIVAAPLLGKQGIYGVLELTARELVTVSENEADYISILAETAGTAFENAQLYQQSRNLIRELRLINQMAQQLNRSLNLDEILQFVTKMLLDTFEAEYCAILSRVTEEELIVLSSSNADDVGKIVLAAERPIADVLKDKQAVILAHPSTETMPFSLAPFASLMAVPLLRESEVTGVLLVLDSRRHFFSFDDFKLLEIFGQHTSLAVTNALLHSEMERMVITDNLTGLYARRYLNQQVQLSLEKDGFGSLILIDIDYFKKINDTYGHQMGDEVLIQVANLIKQNIRDSDIAARWGGEELAIYLPRVDTPTAANIAERIRKCVENETMPKVTISCGVAKWDREHHQNLSVETLFHHADIALYDAKKRGRNQVRLA